MLTLEQKLREIMHSDAKGAALTTIVWSIQETAKMVVRCPNIVIKSETPAGEGFRKTLKMLTLDQRADLHADICLWIATDQPDIDYDAYKY